MLSNVVQLRKICNHPNVYEAERVASPVLLPTIRYAPPSLLARFFGDLCWTDSSLHGLGLLLHHAASLTTQQVQWLQQQATADHTVSFNGLRELRESHSRFHTGDLNQLLEISKRRCELPCLAPVDRIQACMLSPDGAQCVHEVAADGTRYFDYTNALRTAVRLPRHRAAAVRGVLQRFVNGAPSARAAAPFLMCAWASRAREVSTVPARLPL